MVFSLLKKPASLAALLSFLFAFSLTDEIIGQTTSVKIAPAPKWSEKIDHALPGTSTNVNNASGYYYLLVDKQEKLDEEQIFCHYTFQIINNEGIEEVSDINLDYDPEYQELTFHFINIIRNGKTINKLISKDIKTVQREANLERKLFDGRLTAIVNLTDIRKGDILDYAYSIKGSNPIFQGMHDDRIYFAYSLPIERYRYRLIFQKDKKLRFKYNNQAPQPQILSSNDSFVYTWDINKLEPFLLDINTPPWFDPYPYVFISEYGSWESIAEQYAGLYDLGKNEREGLKSKLNGFKKNDSADSVIWQAIRFVQDEIRYLGFENGLNSHKPNNPLDVLNNRYGDCKAKSFLLCEILRSSGIEAAPVLVNSYRGNTIEDNLPSPNQFDHCIVQISNSNTDIYVDPTYSNQGGDLKHLHFPNYKKGLVLEKGNGRLIDLPYANYSGTKVIESFRLEEVGKGAYLNISTTFKGQDADFQRGLIGGTDPMQLKKSYIDFYSTMYPSISAVSDMVITDHRNGGNEIEVIEFYKIDSFWINSDENNPLLYCEFYPLSLETYLHVDQSPNRTMPYYVNYPIDYSHETILKLPEEWNLEESEKTIESDAFTYKYYVSTNPKKREIKILHEYKTHTDHIQPEAVASFVLKHEEVMDNLPYYLTYDKTFLIDQFSFSWFSLIIVLLTLSICIYYAVKIYNNYDIPVSYSEEESLPIGGWLALAAIGLTITPFRIVYDLYGSPEYFNGNVWSAFADMDNNARRMLTGLLMFFELVYNIAFFVFATLVATLLFKKRSILPKFAIILYASSLVFMVLDSVVALSLNPTAYTSIEKNELYKEIARSVFTAAVWIPYFLLSKRVKQTFVLISEKTLSAEGQPYLPEQQETGL